MSNSKTDYNTYIRANLPAGMTYNTSTNRYVVNDKSFITYKLAEWYIGYITKYGATFGMSFSASPVLSGTPIVAQTLSVTNGTLVNSEGAISYTYQWRRDSVSIGSATSNTYTLVSADDGTVIDCQVTADDGVTQPVAASNATATITFPTPATTTDYAITGSFAPAEVLTVGSGVWNYPVTATYEWTREGLAIDGETSATYTVLESDDGLTIGCAVTGTNSGGATIVAATGSGVVSSVTYGIALLGGSGSEFLRAVTTDSSGGVYCVGQTNSDGSGQYDGLIAKYDGLDALQWDRTLGGSDPDYFYGVGLDSSGNIYCVGQTNSDDGAGGSDALVTKYNSSGTLQWSRVLGGTGNEQIQGMVTSSSGDVYGVGYTTSTGPGGATGLVFKYNSSGIFQWSRSLGGNENDVFYDAAIDSSGNVYCAGYTESDGAGGQDALIAKYNSSGVLQWDRTLGGTGADSFYGVEVDSSDNIYCVGYTNSDGAGSLDGLTVKYNSSGVLQWSRTLGGASTDSFSGVAIDSSDNIYCVGDTRSDGEGSRDGFIAKYNSSGIFQWDLTVGGTGDDVLYSIAVDSSSNVYCVGYTTSDGAGGIDGILFLCDADGTATGTAGPFTVQDAVLTDATAVLTDAEAVLTDAAAVFTDAATTTLTDAEAELTSEFLEIT